MKMTDAETRKNTYLTFHKNFVRTDIEYADKQTGEMKTFNQVTLPKGTVIDGKDMGGYQFSPLFVNESRYRGDNYRDVPVLTNRELWLRKSMLDEQGQPVLDANGKQERDVVKVMPAVVKDAMDQALSRYLADHSRPLAERAETARDGSKAQSHNARDAKVQERG